MLRQVFLNVRTMKKILRFLLWLLILLLIVILIKTLTFNSLQADPGNPENPSLNTESIEKLSQAVSFPTISYTYESPVDTTAFSGYLDFITGAYPLVHSKLVKEVFNKFSLLYYWQGKDTSLKPVILMAHHDVVAPGDTALWEKPPFSGEIEGRYIWGRGTLDDKNSMISILEAAEILLSQGFEPERGIYFAFGHDEEIGGNRGAEAIAEFLKKGGTEAEYILDEGLAVTVGMVPMIRKPVALIGTSEKGYLSVKLTVELPGGHSSTPEKESAVIVLNRAVNNLVKRQMKARISGPVRDFIRYVGPEMPFYAKAVFANRWLFNNLILKVYSGTGSGNALIRTTTAPTILSAGIKDNIVPAKAEAVVNFRILPGETSSDVMAHLEKVIGDKRVIISQLNEGFSEPAPVSPADVPAFRILLATVRMVYPEAVVAPSMMLASSDSKHYRQISKNIYRFAPIIVNPEDMVRIHGINERNRTEDFRRGISFYYNLIRNSNNFN
jgi:carboxypeptidase PM20D1